MVNTTFKRCLVEKRSSETKKVDGWTSAGSVYPSLGHQIKWKQSSQSVKRSTVGWKDVWSGHPSVSTGSLWHFSPPVPDTLRCVNPSFCEP